LAIAAYIDALGRPLEIVANLCDERPAFTEPGIGTPPNQTELVVHGSPGLDSQAGPGQAAVDQMRPVLDLLQLALDDPDQAVQVGSGEVGDGALEQRPDVLGGIQVRRISGQPVNAQPGSVLLGDVREFRGEVDVLTSSGNTRSGQCAADRTSPSRGRQAPS
jgi:hypothetical protein